jgi:excisionase family DNA binding protein
MSTVNPNEMLTPTQAARLKGVTRQWIAELIKEGKLPSVQIAGRSFVRQQDVLAYKPSPKSGRPPGKTSAAIKAAAAPAKANNGASVKKKGSKK